jgi:hypothetical protein
VIKINLGGKAFDADLTFEAIEQIEASLNTGIPEIIQKPSLRGFTLILQVAVTAANDALDPNEVRELIKAEYKASGMGGMGKVVTAVVKASGLLGKDKAMETRQGKA